MLNSIYFENISDVFLNCTSVVKSGNQHQNLVRNQLTINALNH